MYTDAYILIEMWSVVNKNAYRPRQNIKEGRGGGEECQNLRGFERF